MFHTRGRICLTLLMVLSALLLAGCPPQVSIADVNRDPGRYAGKDIVISGRTSESFGALGSGVYRIDDGTGSMWVFSEHYGVPGSGAKVAVVGRVEQGFAFGGRSFGTILRETERRH